MNSHELLPASLRSEMRALRSYFNLPEPTSADEYLPKFPNGSAVGLAPPSGGFRLPHPPELYSFQPDLLTVPVPSIDSMFLQTDDEPIPAETLIPTSISVHPQTQSTLIPSERTYEEISENISFLYRFVTSVLDLISYQSDYLSLPTEKCLLAKLSNLNQCKGVQEGWNSDFLNNPNCPEYKIYYQEQEIGTVEEKEEAGDSCVKRALVSSYGDDLKSKARFARNFYDDYNEQCIKLKKIGVTNYPPLLPWQRCELLMQRFPELFQLVYKCARSEEDHKFLIYM